MAQTHLYSRFERLWHWGQTVLIVGLLLTGFEVHGSYQWLGYAAATEWHRTLAWTLIGLWILAWFWHLTTGEWKQYIPSPMARVVAMMRYYAFEIFRGEPHPFHKQRWQKHNPLQRMAYLSLHLLITPLIWLSGLLYLFQDQWEALGLGGLTLGPVAFVHIAAAYLMLTFVVAHLYLALTMDHQPFAALKGMITGKEDLEQPDAAAPAAGDAPHGKY